MYHVGVGQKVKPPGHRRFCFHLPGLQCIWTPMYRLGSPGFALLSEVLKLGAKNIVGFSQEECCGKAPELTWKTAPWPRLGRSSSC